MNFSEWRARIMQPIQDLLANLSPSQRMSLLILAGVVTFAVSLLVFTSPSDGPYVLLANVQDHPKAIELIEAKGIDYIIEGDLLKVPRSQHALALGGGVQAMMDQPEDDFAWLFETPGWQVTARQRSERIKESTKRTLERALEATSHIEDATVLVNKPAQEDWSLRSTRHQSTASITISPVDKEKGLTTKQALAVAKIVSGAFAIPRENIEVYDGQNSFDLSDLSSIYDGDRQGREQALKAKLRDHFSFFTHSEIKINVHLETNAEESRVTTVTYDESKSFPMVKETIKESRETTQPSDRAPGVAENVTNDLNRGTESLQPAMFRENYNREEERSDSFASSETKETHSPANQDRWVNVLVNLSEAAIIDRLRANEQLYNPDAEYQPTREKVQEYLNEKQAEVQQMLVSGDVTRGKVTIGSFTPPPQPLLASADSDSWAALLALYARELVLGLLALVGCFLVYRIAFGSIPELEELPDPVADLSQFLQEQEQLERDELQRLADEAAVVEDPEVEEAIAQDLWGVPDEAQSSLELLDAISSHARQESNTTTSVVRQWIQEAPSDAVELDDAEPVREE